MLGNSSARSRRRRLLHLRTSGAEAPLQVEPTHSALAQEEPLFAEDFFEMCGARSPLKLCVENEESGEERLFQIERPYAIVGRSERCDVQLADGNVSRRHVYLQLVNGFLFACDLGSSTGTFWDGDRAQSGWLTQEQPIAIGPYQIRLSSGSVESTEVPRILPTHRDECDPSSIGAHPVYLEFANNQRGDRAWQVNRDLTLIGSSRACKLQLGDPSISDVHAALVRTQTGIWAVDLLGSGGTFVDGERVDYSSLADGQVLRIGIFRIVVHFQKPRSRGAHMSL